VPSRAPSYHRHSHQSQIPLRRRCHSAGSEIDGVSVHPGAAEQDEVVLGLEGPRAVNMPGTEAE
jgi:hypothetical protein